MDFCCVLSEDAYAFAQAYKLRRVEDSHPQPMVSRRLPKPVECSLSLGIRQVHRRTSSEQLLHDGEVETCACPHERGLAPTFRVMCVDLRTAAQ
jgi:hypothetical protein